MLLRRFLLHVRIWPAAPVNDVKANKGILVQSPPSSLSLSSRSFLERSCVTSRVWNVDVVPRGRALPPAHRSPPIKPRAELVRTVTASNQSQAAAAAFQPGFQPSQALQKSSIQAGNSHEGIAGLLSWKDSFFLQSPRSQTVNHVCGLIFIGRPGPSRLTCDGAFSVQTPSDIAGSTSF